MEIVLTVAQHKPNNADYKKGNVWYHIQRIRYSYWKEAKKKLELQKMKKKQKKITRTL